MRAAILIRQAGISAVRRAGLRNHVLWLIGCQRRGLTRALGLAESGVREEEARQAREMEMGEGGGLDRWLAWTAFSSSAAADRPRRFERGLASEALALSGAFWVSCERELSLQVVVALLARLEANPPPQLRVDNLHCDAKRLLRDSRIDPLIQALHTQGEVHSVTALGRKSKGSMLGLPSVERTGWLSSSIAAPG